MSKRHEHSSQRQHINDQQIYEKELNPTYYQWNANQNHNDRASCICKSAPEDVCTAGKTVNQ